MDAMASVVAGVVGMAAEAAQKADEALAAAPARSRRLVRKGTIAFAVGSTVDVWEEPDANDPTKTVESPVIVDFKVRRPSTDELDDMEGRIVIARASDRAKVRLEELLNFLCPRLETVENAPEFPEDERALEDRAREWLSRPENFEYLKAAVNSVRQMVEPRTFFR